MQEKFLNLLILSLIFLSSSGSAESLVEFLATVKKSNLSWQSTELDVEAAFLKKQQATLMYTPELFATGRWGIDEKQSSFPGLEYDAIKSQNYSLGIKQDFAFGLNTKLYYAYDYMAYEKVTGFNSDIKVHDARPVVELSLPLWGGAFGSSLRARHEMTLLRADAEAYAAQSQKDQILTQAEFTYWRLSIAREALKIQEKALKQSESILLYVSRRAGMNLGEEADKLQAKTLVEAKRFEVKQAQNEVRAASRAYNKLRNVDLVAAIGDLEAVDFESLAKFQLPTQRQNDRSDVKASEAQIAMSRQSAIIERENNKPNLEIFGSYAINGRSDDNRGDAYSDSLDSGRSTTAVGLRFSMPLHIKASYDVRQAAYLNMQAAEIRLKEKKIAQNHDWQELIELLSEAQESLRLAKAIESAQQAKLLSERSRLKTGRTSTFQILQFEQEFTASEFNSVKLAAQILMLQAQLKLYDVSHDGKRDDLK